MKEVRGQVGGDFKPCPQVIITSHNQPGLPVSSALKNMWVLQESICLGWQVGRGATWKRYKVSNHTNLIMSAAGMWPHFNEAEGRGQDTPTTPPSCCSSIQEILTDYQKPNANITWQHQKAYQDVGNIMITQPISCVGGETPPPHNQWPFTCWQPFLPLEMCHLSPLSQLNWLGREGTWQRLKPTSASKALLQKATPNSRQQSLHQFLLVIKPLMLLWCGQ